MSSDSIIPYCKNHIESLSPSTKVRLYASLRKYCENRGLDFVAALWQSDGDDKVVYYHHYFDRDDGINFSTFDPNTHKGTVALLEFREGQPVLLVTKEKVDEAKLKTLILRVQAEIVKDIPVVLEENVNVAAFDQKEREAIKRLLEQ